MAAISAVRPGLFAPRYPGQGVLPGRPLAPAGCRGCAPPLPPFLRGALGIAEPQGGGSPGVQVVQAVGSSVGIEPPGAAGVDDGFGLRPRPCLARGHSRRNRTGTARSGSEPRGGLSCIWDPETRLVASGLCCPVPFCSFAVGVGSHPFRGVPFGVGDLVPWPSDGGPVPLFQALDSASAWGLRGTLAWLLLVSLLVEPMIPVWGEVDIGRGLRECSFFWSGPPRPAGSEGL